MTVLIESGARLNNGYTKRVFSQSALFALRAFAIFESLFAFLFLSFSLASSSLVSFHVRNSEMANIGDSTRKT